MVDGIRAFAAKGIHFESKLWRLFSVHSIPSFIHSFVYFFLFPFLWDLAGKGDVIVVDFAVFSGCNLSINVT